MSENPRKPTKKQVFNMVKSLCLKSKLKEARMLILQAAGIPDEKKEKMSQDKLPAYIRTDKQHPLVTDMLRIEEAFSDLNDTFSDETKNENAFETAQKLEGILPLLNNEEQAYTHYWISNCIEAYNPEDHALRAEHLQKIIELTPRRKNDPLLYGAALNLQHLRIPAGTRYEAINDAFLKTSKDSVYDQTYLSMLHGLGDKYYWEIAEKLQSPQVSYENKNKYGNRAFELINDFKISELQKCSYKIKLLDIMEKIQLKERDFTRAHETSKRKQSFIYLSARIRKKTLGIYHAFDPYR